MNLDNLTEKEKNNLYNKFIDANEAFNYYPTTLPAPLHYISPVCSWYHTLEAIKKITPKTLTLKLGLEESAYYKFQGKITRLTELACSLINDAKKECWVNEHLLSEESINIARQKRDNWLKSAGIDLEKIQQFKMEDGSTIDYGSASVLCYIKDTFPTMRVSHRPNQLSQQKIIDSLQNALNSGFYPNHWMKEEHPDVHRFLWGVHPYTYIASLALFMERYDKAFPAEQRKQMDTGVQKALFGACIDLTLKNDTRKGKYFIYLPKTDIVQLYDAEIQKIRDFKLTFPNIQNSGSMNDIDIFKTDAKKLTHHREKKHQTKVRNGIFIHSL